MQLIFFTFIIGTIFVGLVSGQFPYGNVAPNAGAQASASAQAGGASAQAAAGANNFQNPRAGRQPPAFNNPGNGGGYPQKNGGGPPQRNPPPHNPMNPQQPNDNGRNNPRNPANQYQQQPQQPNYPANQPPQYPNKNGRHNPRHPQQPPQYPNNNARNNPMNPQQPPQYPNNNQRNNPMNPANQYQPPQPPQPPNNNGRNNYPNPDQQQMPNNYPQRPNMKNRNPNGFPRRPNRRNRPQTETAQASTALPFTIPLEYPKDAFPPGFFADMLTSLGISLTPQSKEPTENSLPPITIAETQPPMRKPRNRRPQGPFRRRPGRGRKPTVATTLNPSVLPETTFADEITPQVQTNDDFPTETVSVDVTKTTPLVSDAVVSETNAEENPELVTVPQPIESSSQSNASNADELKDTDNEINLDVYKTSTPEIITKSELESVITTETTTEKVTTTSAEILSDSSALEETEVLEIIYVQAPEAETIPEIITTSSTDIPDHSEAIKTDYQSTTVSPEENKSKSEYTRAAQTSVAAEKTTAEPITSSLLPETTELSHEVTTVALTSKNREESTQTQIKESETTQVTQTPLASTTVSTIISETTSASSSAVTIPSQSSPAESDIFDIKPGDSEFMPVFTMAPSEDEIVSTTESLPRTTCYCTDGVTYVTTESLINIKKATTPIFTVEEAYTKYSEDSNIGMTTPSYTSVATSKEMEEKGDSAKTEAITLTPTAVTLDTKVNSGSTQEDSETDATTPITEDLVLTTAPTITSTVSTVTSTSSSTEITTESSDQSTEYEDENYTYDEDEDHHDVKSATFDANYYETAIPPPGVTCREKERYYKCVPNCRHTCLNYDNFDVPCPDICLSGCFCDPGLVVDENNNCVEISECKDYTCKDDEDWWECMPKNHNTCDTFARADANKDFECESGCFCMDGLIQAPDGSCVNPYECPEPVCGDDETATDCVNACNTCEALCQKPGFCSFTECRPGCDCMDGYKRDSNGTCIQALTCPVCTTPPPSTTTTIIDTTTAPPVDENTTPAQEVEVTPTQKVGTTPAQEVENTPADDNETTIAPSKAVITTPTAVDSTTLSAPEETAQTSIPVETNAEVSLPETD